MFGFGFGLESARECGGGFFDDRGNCVWFTGDDGLEFSSLSGERVSIFVESRGGAGCASREVVHGGPERCAGSGEHGPGKHSFIVHDEELRSHTNADDAVDDVAAEELGYESTDEHFLSGWMVKEEHDVIAVKSEDSEEEDDGECHEHDAAESSFAGECFDLPEDFEAFADQFADFGEDLGEVAARLPLDGNSGDEELKVHIGDAVEHISEGLFDWQSEILFFEDGFEFHGDGCWHFCGDDIESGGEAVS